jgi:DNA replication and repair protein RecF
VILEHLAISGLRNIDFLEVNADRCFNWITGGNGAGKTSILEAIYLLSRGRGFRGRKHGPLLGADHSRLEVSADFRSMADGLVSHVKFAQSRDESLLFENGNPIPSVQYLRHKFHVRLIADNSQKLLEGQPATRRLFLDWNLFHVEQGYGRILTDFRRVLAQRNAWLKAGALGPAVWDADYSRLGNLITGARQRLVTGLDDLSRKVLCEQGMDMGIFRVDYRSGWGVDRSLADALRDSIQHDRERGYTYHGPARGDFICHWGGGPRLASRGQTKFIVFLLQLAAQMYWQKLDGPTCAWLLDDLGAELDAATLNKILLALYGMGSQVFISAITENGGLPRGYSGGGRFHVEQGRIV